MEKIAQLLIDAVEELGIERRCVNKDETWEEAKEDILKEARKGIWNYQLWLRLEWITWEIKHLTNDY